MSTNKAPLCTCVDRGEPDWNGRHDDDCPWLEWTEDRLSIAALRRRYSEGGATQAVLDIAPALLEIAATGLAWSAAEDALANARGAMGRTRASMHATEAFDKHRAALAKVRP